MKPQLKPIADQVVVIVGTSSGIGRQTARRFAERRATVVITARDEGALNDALEDVRAAGAANALGIVADVVEPGQLEDVAARAVESFGRIDTWVQIPGVAVYAPFEDTTPDEFRRVIEVNLLGQAYGAMAALPRLRAAGGGALIEVSSVEADVALPYHSAYAASKHGMSGFLRALRIELEAEGAPIAVTQVQPASIDTPFFRNARTKLGVEPRPVPPVYDPDIVAQVILHAAEHPTRDVYAGGAGIGLAALRRLSPRLLEAVLARIGEPLQRTNTPKDEAAGDSLDAPLATTNQVHGGYGGRRWSVGTWLQLHPWMVRAAAGVATLGGLVVLRRRGQERG
ncbi:MAG: SDR family oxidoreductase [Chloroflexota bacterium]|jgi:NAD(P)-dependent dehydrogenase (short-subunit alcohol dehydrogenase family)